MASGTGNLPNQNMVFTPFDILTAEEQNQLVENIESLADGTGIGDDAVTTAKINDDAVTPEKRSGGIKVGTFTSSSSTGNQSITGVGFKPKCVKFVWLLPTSSNANYADGVMSEDGDQYARTILVAGGANTTISVTNRCFITPSGAGTTREASFVSMDADGFTINWDLASTATPIGYTAEA